LICTVHTVSVIACSTTTNSNDKQTPTIATNKPMIFIEEKKSIKYNQSMYFPIEKVHQPRFEVLLQR
jgi:hypothetical protein